MVLRKKKQYAVAEDPCGVRPGYVGKISSTEYLCDAELPSSDRGKLCDAVLQAKSAYWSHVSAMPPWPRWRQILLSIVFLDTL